MHPHLTSCCVASILLGHERVFAHGPGVGTPFKVQQKQDLDPLNLVNTSFYIVCNDHQCTIPFYTPTTSSSTRLSMDN